MAVKKLYLMRHGETLFNTKYIVQGMCDSRLTVNGHQQAEHAKEIFEAHHITFDHAYCSKLSRTEETIAHIVSIPYERKQELNERCYGTMEGESRSIAEKLTYVERSALYELCGGEKAESVIERMQTFLHEIMSKDDHYSVLCVSHGAAIGYFMHNIGEEIPIHDLKNCHILEFEYDGKFHFIKDYV